MSADRYSECPHCKRDRRNLAAERQAEADAAYGKVPIAEFDQLRESARLLAAQIDQPEREYTFREDWEIGRPTDGSVYLGYSGGCEVWRPVVALRARPPHRPELMNTPTKGRES